MKRLKLKRNQQNHKVALSIKGRTYFWTKDLLLALLFAGGVHLVFILLFEIDFGKFSLPQTESSNITVLETTINKAFVLSDKEHESKNQIFIYAGIARPERPEILASLTEFKPLNYIQDSGSHGTIDSLPSLEDSSQISLGKRFFFSHGFPADSEFNPPLQSQISCKGKLEFQASTETGRVIWIHWLASTGQVNLDKEIEGALKNQRFKLPSEALFKYGVLEIEFRS